MSLDILLNISYAFTDGFGSFFNFANIQNSSFIVQMYLCSNMG